MQEICVRVAREEDVKAMCDLLAQLFSKEVEFTPDAKVQAKALHMILEEKTGAILVATCKEKVVGMVNLLDTISTALGDKVILLEDMIVHEDFRNQHIGSKLLSKALEYAKENGYLRVTLLSDEDNEKAHEFYKRHGFSESARKVFTAKTSLADI